MSTKTVLCAHCHVEFNMQTKEFNRHNKMGWKYKFCSSDCRIAHQRINGKESVERLQSWVHSDENRQHLKNNGGWNPGNSGYIEFLRRIRNRKKSQECDLTIQQLKELWENQKGICPYTGWQLELPKHRTSRSPRVASLDRIDSSKGYVLGNVQYVSMMANFAKNNFTIEEMAEFCDAIKKNWGSP